MSDEEAGSREVPITLISRSPSLARTLPYDAASNPRRVSSSPYEPVSPQYSPGVDAFGNERRPLSTRESWEWYKYIEAVLETICGPRATSKGWDRIQKILVPLERCPCCHQKIRNRRDTSVPSYVIGDREYGMVDSVLARVYSEIRGAAVSSRDRLMHLGNVFHILAENEDLLQRSLQIILYRKCRRVIEVLHHIFKGNVPEMDVQTS